MIDLVTQNHERDLVQLLHAQQSVEFGFRFRKTLVILGVNKEYDAGDFWEVVLPETAGWIMLASFYHAGKQSRWGHTLLMSTQVESREFNVANGKFFGCWMLSIYAHVLAASCASDWEQLTRVKSRLEDGDSVILHGSQYQPCASHPRRACQSSMQTADLEDYERIHQRTFNICNSVVFPALSRPRNSSFACLFRSPSDARVSQTIEQITISSPSSPRTHFPFPDLQKSYLHQLTIHILEMWLWDERMVLEVIAADVRDVIYFAEMDNFLDTWGAGNES